MTLAELLALLGRSWSLVLLYPGGLGLLSAVLLVRYQDAGRAGVGWFTRSKLPIGHNLPADLFLLTAIAAPWLGLALLPLPFAVSVGRSLDLLVALALLEWPRLLVAVREAQSGHVARLAALLNSYPPLIGALLLLAVPAGSLDLASIIQPPGATTSLMQNIAYWFGALGVVLALPALLGLGPFASPAPESYGLRLGLAVRTVALVVLAAFPWAGLIPEALRWLVPVPLIAVVLVSKGFDWLGRKQPALRWAQALLWLCALELVLLLLAGIQELALRLQ